MLVSARPSSGRCSGYRAPWTSICDAARSISPQVIGAQLHPGRAEVHPRVDDASSSPESARSRASAPAARRARVCATVWLSSASANVHQPVDERRFALRFSAVKRGTTSGSPSLSKVGHSVVDPPGEEPLAERAEGHEADAQVLERRHDFLFGVPAHHSEVPLCSAGHGLHRSWARRDRLQAPASDRPKCFTLTLANEVLDRAGDVLDRDVRVDAVLIEQIDPIGL